jgi:hypothetical protein
LTLPVIIDYATEHFAREEELMSYHDYPGNIEHKKLHEQLQATIEEAQGVAFLCPACIKVYGGPAGTHSVICWSSSRGVPDGVHPQPGRWTLEGTGLHDLTLGCEPDKSNSVLLISKCAWHGFITNGEVIDA